MTLIAGFSFEKQPFLIGDLLLSGPETLGHSISLPTIADSREVFPDGSGFTVTGLTQKVNILSDHLMIAWSGRAYVAKSILRDIKERIEEEPFTYESLQEYLESFRRSNDRNEVQFVGTLIDGGKIASFGIGCQVIFAAPFGDVCLGGSGAEDAKVLLLHCESPKIKNGATPPLLLEGISRTLVITGHLLQSELMSQSSLLQFYGAGYEIASLVEGRFAKISDVTYLFWEVDATDVTVRVSYPYEVFKYSYRNDVLAIRNARISPNSDSSILTFDDSVHLVEPAFRSINKEEIKSFRIPPMNSQFLVNVFQVRFRDGSIEWFNRIDYRYKPNSYVVFDEVPQGLQIGIQQRFVASLGQEIQARIRARQTS